VTGATRRSVLGEVGVIAPGAFADALVLDDDPLENIHLLASAGADLRLILANGCIVKDEFGLCDGPAET
jgi:imidazolonepropionase-like amidohydrolase